MWQIKRWARWPVALLTIAVVLAMVAGCGNKEKDVVATYKDGKVTHDQLDKFIGASSFFNQYIAMAKDDPQVQEMMLKQFVTMNILDARASAQSKKDAETKTKDQMKQIDDYYNTQPKGALDTQLKDLKISKQDLQNYVNTTLTVINDYKAKVTDQQVQDNYNQKLKDDPHAYDIATVSHILVATQDASTGKDLRSLDDALKRAQEVKDKLDKGGDFAALAKEYSDDPGSKDNGGKYENQPTSQWDPDFKNAVETLPIGKISDPVKTSFGYHIMKVESRSTQTLDQVKEDLRSEVAQNQINDFMTNELPKLDYQSKLPPAPSPSPSASAAPSPAASVSPSPAASPAAK